jgi:hypothetical protein
MRATITAAAMATIATVETAKSIIPFSFRRLLIRPYGFARARGVLRLSRPGDKCLAGTPLKPSPAEQVAYWSACQ